VAHASGGYPYTFGRILRRDDTPPYTVRTGDDGDEYVAPAAERVRRWCEPDADEATEDPSRAGALNARTASKQAR